VTQQSTRRRVGTAVGILILGLLATGCSAVGATSTTSTPAVGECWATTYAQSQQSEDWEGTAAIPCTRRHESYTYAVTKLTTRFSGSWRDAKGSVRADVDDAAYAACLAQQNASLPGLPKTEALLKPTYYLPSVPLWNGGARWVRCDVTEVKVGSLVTRPVLAPLPARFSGLTSALKANPKKFALCEDDPENNGPDGAQTTFADCTGPSDWSFVLARTIPGGSSAPYPGKGVLNKIGASECLSHVTASGHDVFAETPSSLSWTKYDDREVDCWINNN
jgi:Septum formation